MLTLRAHSSQTCNHNKLWETIKSIGKVLLRCEKSFREIIKKLFNDPWLSQMRYKFLVKLCGTKWNQRLNRLALAQTSFPNRVNSSRLFLSQLQFISSQYLLLLFLSFSCLSTFDTCYHLSWKPFVSANIMQLLCFLKHFLQFVFSPQQKITFKQFVFLIIMNPRKSRLEVDAGRFPLCTPDYT